MTLSMRKGLIIGLVGAVFLLANIWIVVNWLQASGAVEVAKHVRHEYLTGTAITILVALLVLLVGPGARAMGLGRRCPVCDHALQSGARYCSECGSKA